MPIKPLPADDQLAQLAFPTQGIDLSREYEQQPPGTAAVAHNVRAFEPGTERSRGGSRPGIVRYIDGLVNGQNVIQHLNLIVDPTEDALLDFDPPGGVTGGSASGATTDPTTGVTQGGIPRNGSGRLVRTGGTAIQPTLNRKNRNAIELVQFIGFANDGALAGTNYSLAFASPVTAGNLVIAYVIIAKISSFEVGPWAPTSIGDSSGNMYHLIRSIFGGEYTSASLYYAMANTTGALTVTYQADDLFTFPRGGSAIVLMEFKNVSSIQPVDGSVVTTDYTPAGTGPPYTFHTGSLTVHSPAEMMIAFYAGQMGIGATYPWFTKQSGFTVPTNPPGGQGFLIDGSYLDSNLNTLDTYTGSEVIIQYRIGSAATGDMTGAWNGQDFDFTGIGVGFNQR